MKTYLFHVNGMHCNACEVLIESELMEVKEVSKAKPSLKNNNVEITGDFGDKKIEHIANDLTEVLKKHGYSLSIEKQKHNAKWSDFSISIPIAFGFFSIFILLQKLGIVNLINSSDIGYGTAFVIGIIASISTCMAVVGGLVLSVSANFAKENDKIKPQIMFHAGRLVSFFVLGGLIGALGSAFQFGALGTFILNIFIVLILIILGINLLDVFPWMKKLQPTLPSFIGKHVQGLKKINHTLTPLLLGIATFFLPCGFTQSMQLYALTTGSFMSGAIYMFIFALGTLPVLALLSFTSIGIHNRTNMGIFFKAAGLIVILFALYNLINALVGFNVISPIFSL